MNRYFFTAVLIFINMLINGQTLPVPAGYTILEQKEGDLTKDGVAEKVIVFNTNDSTDDGTVREIQVYKNSGNKWEPLVSSKNAVGHSEGGGMMGDPFEGIEIINGLLLIKQSGGSSWKWSKIDKYRYQKGIFQLIGFESYYGKACEYFEDVDFNLLTGKIVYKKEYEDCDKGQQIIKNENETFYKKGIKIDLSDRTSKEIKIIAPQYKNEFYL